jgi:hypothetical protein
MIPSSMLGLRGPLAYLGVGGGACRPAAEDNLAEHGHLPTDASDPSSHVISSSARPCVSLSLTCSGMEVRFLRMADTCRGMVFWWSSISCA